MRCLLLPLVLLAGCDRAPPVGTETIVYDLTPSFCFGCKAFAIRLHPDGRGEFLGNRATAVSEGSFRATPAQVRAFAERLAPYRPRGVRSLARSGRECADYTHDGATIDIRWRRDGEAPARLTLYSGCDEKKHAAMWAALAAAPDVLPLRPLLGPE